MRFILGTLLLSGLGLMGCGAPDGQDPLDPLNQILTPKALDLNDGHVTGDFGPRHNFDGPATKISRSSDSWHNTSASITRSEDDRAGMMIIELVGRDFNDYFPGTYNFDAPYDAPPEEGQIRTFVCSGNTADSMDFDIHADSTVMDVGWDHSIVMTANTAGFAPATVKFFFDPNGTAQE